MGGNNKKIIVGVGANTAEFNKAMAKMKNQTKSVSDDMVKFGKMMGAAFTVGAITAFGKSVIDITSRFQTYNAVLKNTLGSQAQATASMSLINDFATKTPFSVDELTASFVKLANQGFVPSRDQLTKLGDVASSTGKSFDQLVEGMLDATMGEFERLKEFGIKAKKEGDKIVFTFKGVQTQVDNNADSIREYIIGLGELEGVMGSMAAISETLGGKVSNLGDAYDQWLVGLGQKSSGLFVSIFEEFTTMLNNMTSAMSASELLKSAKVDAGGFFSGNDELNAEASRLVNLQKSLVGKSQDEIDAVIRETSQKMGFYSGEAGVKFNNLYAKFIGNLQELILNPVKAITTVTNPPSKPKNKDSESDFKSDNIEKTIDLYQRYTDIRQKGEKILTDSAKKELKAQEDAVNNWYDNTLKSNVDHIENKKELDRDYWDNYIDLQNEAQEKITQHIQDMNSILETSIENAAVNMGQTIADLITGDMGIEGLLNSILSSLGDFLKKMGAAIIAYGIAMEAFKKAFSNPIVAITAGAGLIVTGSLISNIAQKGVKLAEGGVVPDGYPNDTYPALLSSKEMVVPADKLPEFGAQQVQVYGVIKAGDIYLSSERGKYLTNRKS